MKKYLFLLVFIVSVSFGYGQRYNVTELSTSDNKYTLNGVYYSGKAYSLTKKAQLKEEFTIENGMLNGLYELFKTDDNYTHSKYQDTLLISRTINNIVELEIKIKELQKDSIRKLDSVWYQEEELLGGRIFKQTESIEVLKRKEKLKSIEEKYVDDKLNNKKTIEYNKYVELQKEFTNCHVTLVLKRSELKQKNEALNLERGKPMFQNTLSETYYYVAGNQTGIHTVYDKSGNKEIEETLNNSKKDGAFKKYSGNKIVEEGNYVNNEKDGEWITQSNSEKITQNYSKGKLNGAFKKYNGEVQTESGQYIEGLKSGEWKTFNRLGEIILIENYKLGLLDGYFKKYDGKVIIEEGTYSNGLMNGEWVYRYKDGQIHAKGLFKVGNGEELVKVHVGKEDIQHSIPSIPKSGRDGLWSFYFSNGKLIEQSNWKSGVLHGSFLGYEYDDEFWRTKGELSNGLLSGNWEFRFKYNAGNVILNQEFTITSSATDPYKEKERADYINEANKNIADGIGGFGSYMIIADYLKKALDIRDDPKTRVLYEEYSEKYDNSYNSVKNRVSNNETQNNSNQIFQCTGHIKEYRYDSVSGNLTIQISSVKCGGCGTSLNYGSGWLTFEGNKDDCNEKEYYCKGGIGYNGCGAKNVLKPCILKGYEKDYDF